MQTTLKEKSGARATVEVTAEAAEVDRAYEQVLGRLRQQVRVPGFRPGKAPRGVLIKRVGEEALAEEVREALVDQGYPQAVREHELAPVHAHAHGDPPEQGNAFTFELHVDLYPQVELPDLGGIVIDAAPEPIGEEAVQQTVENLRRDHATQVPVDRPTEATDHVTIETVGEDGEPREDGSAMPVDLETVGEEIAAQLVGASIGEVVELRLADPSREADDAEQEASGEQAAGGEEAAGAGTRMRVRIADVKAKEKPEPDDEFAKTLGFDDWGAVLAEIRRGLEAQAREQARQEQREELVEKLLEATEVELPASMVQRRRMNLLENLSGDLQQRGLTLDGYLQRLEADGKREEFEGELDASARKSVKRELILERLREMRGTEVDEPELQEALRQLASQEGLDPGSLRERQGEEWIDNYRHLLARDKALREIVEELVGGRDGAAGEVEEAAPDAGEAASETSP